MATKPYGNSSYGKLTGNGKYKVKINWSQAAETRAQACAFEAFEACKMTRDDVYDAVLKYWRDFAVPPAIRHVQKMVGISSTSVVTYHYRHLVKDRRIIIVDHRPVPVVIEKLIKESVNVSF